MKQAISTDNAPAAIGPYSQGMWAGNMLFLSGQVGLDPATGELVGEGVEEQAVRTMENIAALLESQGLDFNNVVKTTIFATDIAYFQAVNEVYGKRFADAPPARSFIQVAALPKGAKVEIETVALKG
ncbi:MAG: RidA family protein [Synergistales bacterium]|nr:RidA family protein [Synergistales bacterium]